MNQHRVFGLCVLLAFCLSTRAQELDAIRWLSPTPTGNDLNRIIFLNDKNGWVVGDYGTILCSSDGGFNWKQVPSGTGSHLRAITFVSPLKGWIVGDDGAILVTTNGGKKWEQLPPPGLSTINDVAFIDEHLGIAVGDSGTILRTTDGGAHWDFVRKNDPRSYTRIVLDSQRDGIITGSDGTVYRVERVGPIVPAGDLYDKPFIDASLSRTGNQFILLSGDGHILSSADRRDWSGADGPQDLKRKGESFSCIAAPGENSVLVASTVGRVWVSQDRMSHWRLLSSSLEIVSLGSFTCRDDTTAFAVGGGGEIVRIDTKRLTISSVTKGALPSINRAVFLDEENALALTASKQLLMTTDGGNTWRREGESFSITTALFRSIQFVSPEVGFALATESVLRTSDGGQSWLVIPFSLDFQPRTMGSLDEGEVWFSGDGYVAVTERAGESLLILLDSRESKITKLNSLMPSAVQPTLPFSDYVLSVSGVGAREWVIMTSHKSIYKTSDGGEHWESLGKPSIDPVVALSTPRIQSILLDQNAHGQVSVGGARFVNVELPSDSSFSITDLIRQGRQPSSSASNMLAPISGAWVFPDSMMWVACGKGLALKSLDGGRSWVRMRLRIAGEITSISFSSISEGWCSTTERSLFITRDGGNTWQLLSLRTPGKIVSMYMTSGLRGFAVNDNGDLLFTVDGGLSWMRKMVPATEGVSDMVSDPSGSAWIALGRSLLEVQSPVGSVGSIRKHRLPLLAGIRKLGTASDSSVLFVSDSGEVGSIRGGGSEPVILAGRLPRHDLIAIGGPEGLRPTVLTADTTHYRRNESGKWEAFSFPSKRSAISVSYVARSRGIVVGTQGMIYVTNDGGTTWSEAPRATYSSLRAIASSSAEGLIWVAGDEGAVLVSRSDDIDFRRILLPFDDRVIQVQFIPPDLLFLASKSGGVLQVHAFDVTKEER
jgi:photosystem II stability/assembly factor-like uncharacterized protein